MKPPVLSRRTIPIACAINASYALPLVVMLLSLRAHLREGRSVVLYLLQRGLPQPLLEAIAGLVELRVIELPATALDGLPRDRRFPPEAAAPLLLPRLLPEDLDCVLFLDCDALVLDDIALLWETGPGQASVAAARDDAIPCCGHRRGVKGCRQLGVPPGAPYFNAGVLLIHLRRWRERDVAARAFHYMQQTGPRLDFLHQEALNAVLWNDCKPLERRWNLLASLAGRPHGWPAPQPGIVHFSGRFKPWRHSYGGPFAERYQTFLGQAREIVPAREPGWKDRALGVYDRHARRYLYWLERALWERRLL